MEATTITIRTNKNTKVAAKKLFSDLGMDMSTAINTFLSQSVREQGLPFRPSTHAPNATTAQALKDIQAGQNLVGPFDTVEEVMDYLNA